MTEEVANRTGRRLMHTRSVECNGYLRDDGLWEVEARLVDTKPFTQDADRYREDVEARRPRARYPPAACGRRGMTIHEAQATMAATPYPDLHRGRTGVAAAGRREYRQRLARGGPAQDRPARRLHAFVGADGPGRDHAVPDHIPRQRSGKPRFTGKPAETPASGRSSSTAAIPGAPTDPSSPTNSRNSRPGLAHRTRRETADQAVAPMRQSGAGSPSRNCNPRLQSACDVQA